MKLEVGKTYETRDGKTVRIVCTDRKHMNQPVIGLVRDENGVELAKEFCADGRYFTNVIDQLDIVREHIPVTYRWVNVYGCKDSDVTGNSYYTEGEALGASGARISGRLMLAFDHEGKLLVDKCTITAVGH